MLRVGTAGSVPRRRTARARQSAATKARRAVGAAQREAIGALPRTGARCYDRRLFPWTQIPMTQHGNHNHLGALRAVGSWAACIGMALRSGGALRAPI